MTKYNKYNNFFLTEDDGGGGGGGEAPVTQQAPAAPVAPAFDTKQFAGAIADVFEERDARKPKEFTPEQRLAAQKALGFWEPDDSFITEFGNLETQKGAFAKMRDGLTAQMVQIQRAMMKEVEDRFEQRLTPMQSMIQERQVAEQKTRFASAYPTLNNPKLQPMIEAIGANLAKTGAFSGKTESDAFAILARGVEEVIQQTNPTFKLETNQPTNGRSSNAIPHTSSGSGGGGGNSTGGKSLSTAASILGPVKVK